MESVKSILHEIFDRDAIFEAAMAAMGDDIRCEREYPAEMSENDYAAFCKKYEGKYPAKYTRENAEKFRRRVDLLCKRHPSTRLYAGLSETEHFAVHKLYYFNSH